MESNNKKQSKRTMLFCEPCGFKQIFEPNVKPEGLAEVKMCPIQTNIPQLDPATQKTIIKPAQPQAAKYKCPCCGRAVKLKELLKPYADALAILDAEKEKQRLEEEKKKRIADGKPPEKKEAPEFLG